MESTLRMLESLSDASNILLLACSLAQEIGRIFIILTVFIISYKDTVT